MRERISRRREQRRRKGQSHVCQAEESVPAPLWGWSSTDWILNLNGQQNARRGSPHSLQTHKVTESAGKATFCGSAATALHCRSSQRDTKKTLNNNLGFCSIRVGTFPLSSWCFFVSSASAALPRLYLLIPRLLTRPAPTCPP